MATQTHLEAVREGPQGSAPGEKGLESGAISFVSNVVIGTASVAPAYSLAATLGFIVAVPGVGLAAPAVLLVPFIPMRRRTLLLPVLAPLTTAGRILLRGAGWLGQAFAAAFLFELRFFLVPELGAVLCLAEFGVG